MSVPVHRCRFMDFERPGISALAFNASSSGPKSQLGADTRLAVGRTNGDIEIWNPLDLVCEVVVPGARGRTVDDLCWVRQSGSGGSGGHRLFSVGGTDTIVEWDLGSGLPRQFARSDAGVIWSLSASPSGEQLAVATEQGTIVVFDVTDGKLEAVKRVFSGSEASLASVAWQSATQVVAGGADGRVRVFDLEQSRVVATLRVDKQKARPRGNTKAKQDTDSLDTSRSKFGGAEISGGGPEETVVWSVLPLPRSGQLVTGDSNGFVKVWDAKTWSLQQSLQPHEGDVLCLATNHNGTQLFSSGLDQKIVNSRLTEPRSGRWTVMNSSVAHTHDIRCMAALETGKMSMLVSGGLEPTFVISSMQQFVATPHRKVAAARFPPQVQVAGSNFVVEWAEQTASVWQVGGTRKLRARIKVSGDDFLTSAAFDPELGLLALGTLYRLRLFLVDTSAEGAEGSETTEVVAVPLPNWNEEWGARFLQWVEPEKLLVVTDSDAVVVYDTDQGSTTSIVGGGDDDEEEEIPRRVPEKLPYTNRIALLAVSNGLVAIARHSKLVDVYTVTGKFVSSLPSLPAEITAMAFRPATANLVVATADRGVTEFDAAAGQLTAWSRLNMGRMPPQLAAAAEPAYGIFSGVGKPERMWLWGPSWLATIDFSSLRPLRKRKHESAPAKEEEDDDDVVDEAVVEDRSAASDDMPAFWMSQKYKPIFYAGPLGSELLVSEKPDTAVATRKLWTNRRIQV